MSELRDIILSAVNDRYAFTAETCKNLNNGGTFQAEFQEIADIELNTELGRDPREAVLMNVVSDADAAKINIGTIIQVSMFGTTTKLQVLRRSNNPASPHTEFGLMQLIPGKDS